jgi:hypothetical protein
MGLLMCLKQPLVLAIFVAPFETFLPYTKEKKIKKNPTPYAPQFKKKKKLKIHLMLPWASIKCELITQLIFSFR